MARPVEYTTEHCTKAREYLGMCIDSSEQQLVGVTQKADGSSENNFKNKPIVRIPTIEGLAVFLNISRSTLYEWVEKYEEFSDIIEQLKAMQGERLISKGLSGEYNPTIAKVLLTKHGYREGVEQSGAGGSPIQIVVEKYADNKDSPQVST